MRAREKQTKVQRFVVSEIEWMVVAPLTKMGYVERALLRGKTVHSVLDILPLKYL